MSVSAIWPNGVGRKRVMFSAVIGVLVVVGLLVGPIMSNVEKPDYEVVVTEDNIEVRRYQSMIVAEVEVEGERDGAAGEGFRLLADYIFGNNKVKQSISMTAPVQQQESKKIAMTAPVLQQKSVSKSWSISFVMPSEYSMESLPKPNDDRITLKTIPARRVVAIRFSGTSSNENIAEHEKKLIRYIEANNIKVAGPPRYAFYNPPWTLPLMRRNEVMFEVKG